jgi:hypothetical protein
MLKRRVWGTVHNGIVVIFKYDERYGWYWWVDNEATWKLIEL